MRASKIKEETKCTEHAKRSAVSWQQSIREDTPLMLLIWSPEEIQALADGMEISLTDHEIRTVLAHLEDIPEDQRMESGISSAAGDGDYQQRERKPPGDRPC